MLAAPPVPAATVRAGCALAVQSAKLTQSLACLDMGRASPLALRLAPAAGHALLAGLARLAGLVRCLGSCLGSPTALAPSALNSLSLSYSPSAVRQASPAGTK